MSMPSKVHTYVSMCRCIVIIYTHELAAFTPPSSPLSNLPSALPPANTCAFNTDIPPGWKEGGEREREKERERERERERRERERGEREREREEGEREERESVRKVVGREKISYQSTEHGCNLPIRYSADLV